MKFFQSKFDETDTWRVNDFHRIKSTRPGILQKIQKKIKKNNTVCIED